MLVVVDDGNASVGSLEGFDFSGFYLHVPLYTCTSCGGRCLFAVGIDCEVLVATLVVVQ